MRTVKNECLVNTFLEEKTLKEVNSFKYLKSTLTWNGNYKEKIRSRISVRKRAFGKLKALGLLTVRMIPIEIRKKFAK